MVTGLTAVFVWAKWKQAEGREVRAVSVVSPSGGGRDHADRCPDSGEFHARHRDGAVNIPVDEVETLAPQLVRIKNTLLLCTPLRTASVRTAINPEKKMGYSRVEMHRLDM